jgi:predicted transcriptional regulator
MYTRHITNDIDIYTRHIANDIDIYTRHIATDIDIYTRHITNDIDIYTRHITNDIDIYTRHITNDIDIYTRHIANDIDIYTRHIATDIDIYTRHITNDIDIYPRHISNDIDIYVYWCPSCCLFHSQTFICRFFFIYFYMHYRWRSSYQEAMVRIPSNLFNPATLLYKAKARTCISNVICCGIFVFSEFNLAVGVPFVDSDVIVDHHCLQLSSHNGVDPLTNPGNLPYYTMY